MGTNEVVKSAVKKGKGKLPTVAKISYTPQTLAAAIAKNIRAEQEKRDIIQGWKQQQWGNLKIEDLIKSEIKVNQLSKTSLFEDGAVSKYDSQYSARDWIAVPCGTTACIAGWAGSLSGDVMVVNADTVYDMAAESESGAYSSWGRETSTEYAYSPDLNAVVHISDRARQLLGLTKEEGAYAFSQDRTKFQVLEYLDAISSGRRVSETAGFAHQGSTGSYGVPQHEVSRGGGWDDESMEYEVTHPNFDAECLYCKVWDEAGRPSFYDNEDRLAMPEEHRKTSDVS